MSDDAVESKSRLNKVRQAYQALFNDPRGTDAARIVLEDLAKFCAAGRTPCVFGATGVDVNGTLVAVGRLEVWHRINQNLGLPDRDVVRLAITQAD